MAIYAHNLEEQDILDDYPSQGGAHVTEDSQGLNLRVIRGYRDQAAGIINARLKRHGIVPEDLEEGSDEAEVARAAIRTYAVAKMLFKVQRADEGRDFMRQWSELRDSISDEPENLGDAQSTAASISSNISTDAVDDGWGGDFSGW